MSALELLNLPPAEWDAALSVMSYNELKQTAERIRKAAIRVLNLDATVSEHLEESEGT